MTLNTAKLQFPMGSNPNASTIATPTIIIEGDGGLATYRCAVDDGDIGEYRTSDPWGNVSVFIATPLSDGAHTFTFAEISPHPGGPVGYPCQPYSFSVDTRPPSAPTIGSVVVSGPNATGKYSLKVTGTITAGEDVYAVRIYAGYAGIGGSGVSGTTWSGATAPLAPGLYDITATASDPAGNVSPRSAPWHVTLGTPPVATPPSAGAAAGSSTVTTVTQVLLTWSPPANGGSPITSYHVYRSGVLVSTVGLLTYTDFSPVRGASYTWSALNLYGEGPQSPPVVPWP